MAQISDPKSPKPIEKSAATAIIVFGMHRSGTSLIAGILHELGAAVPANLLAADDGNPTGYWEGQYVVDLNDEIVASVGQTWRSWQGIPINWYESEDCGVWTDRAAALVRDEFDDDQLVAIKDPRTALLAPLWLAACDVSFTGTKVLLTLRNPLECAASLSKRDGLTQAAGLAMWLRYTLDAERATREYDRAFVSYYDALGDWRAFAGRLAAELHIEWPSSIEAAAPAIDEMLSGGRRNHTVSSDSLNDPTIPVWVARAYSLMQLAETRPFSAAELSELDDINTQFSALGAFFLEADSAKELERAQAQYELAKLNEDMAEQNAQSARREANLADELERQRAEVRELSGQLSGIRNSRSWKLTKPLRR